MKFNILTILLALFFIGCQTPASKINGVRLGMSRADVLAVMGTPFSITNDPTAEYLNYSLAEGSTSIQAPSTPYEIKIVNGKVVSYGRAGAPTAGTRTQPIFIPQPIIH